DAYGRAGLGTYRALMQDREVGRYHRPLFGPYAELRTGPAEDGKARAGVDAFGGSLADPSRMLAAVPAHEELRATGGSLYYLGVGSVAEGSELLRWRCATASPACRWVSSTWCAGATTTSTTSPAASSWRARSPPSGARPGCAPARRRSHRSRCSWRTMRRCGCRTR
ncbi:hypothetical protein ACLESO_57090, partial [Pyxidicoccus sp. 3LG]